MVEIFKNKMSVWSFGESSPIKQRFLALFIMLFSLSNIHAQYLDMESIKRQATAIGEANAPRLNLQCTNNKQISNAYLKLIQYGLVYPNYYLVGLQYKGENYIFRIPLPNFPHSLIAQKDNLKFDFLNLTFYCEGNIFKFKSLGVTGGANIGIPTPPNNYENNDRNNNRARHVCQSCKGTGICGICHGKGYFINGYSGDPIACTHCSAENGHKCTICNGTGYW